MVTNAGFIPTNLMIATEYQVPGAVIPPGVRFNVNRPSSRFFYVPPNATTTARDGTDSSTSAPAFSDIVDEDQGPAYARYVRDEIIVPLVNSTAFSLAILGVIIVNALTIGLATSPAVERSIGTALKYIDTIFMALYCFEIWLKWYGNFWKFWTDFWNWFDAIVVFATLFGVSMDFIASARVLRVLRVVQTFRSQRGSAGLSGLQIIVQTLVRSAPTIFNVLIMTLIVMFVFACIGVGAFAEHSPAFFGTIPRALFTMYIYLTQDGWVDVLEDLEGKAGLVAPGVFSVVFIVIGSWIMIEIIVGVTVNILVSAHEAAKKEERNAYRRMERSTRRVPPKVDDPLMQQAREAGIAFTGAESFGGATTNGGASEGGSEGVAADTVAAAGAGAGAGAGMGGVSWAEKTLQTWTLPPTTWENQKTWETPLPSITAQTVEAYLLVLSALEDNLAEFAATRMELESIYRTVRRANEFTGENDSDSLPVASESDNDSTSDDGDDEDDEKRDTLAHLIAAERRGRSVALAQQRIRQARTRRIVLKMRDMASEDLAKSSRAVEWALGGLASRPQPAPRLRRRGSFQDMFEACGVSRSTLLDSAERMMAPEVVATTAGVAAGAPIASTDAAASVLALGVGAGGDMLSSVATEDDVSSRGGTGAAGDKPRSALKKRPRSSVAALPTELV